MKICPACQERYDDDVESCPKDGEALDDLPDALPGNPKLMDVVSASPADRTSMIDLEAMEAKRKAKRAARGEPEESPGEADDKTPPPDSPMEADGDATGTLQRTRGKKKKPKTVVAAAPDADDPDGDADGDEAPDPRIPADRRVNEEATNKDMSSKSRSMRSKTGTGQRGAKPGTSVTMVDPDAPGTKAGTRAGTQMKRRPKRSLSGTQAAFLVMFGLLALVAGIVFVARATSVLTVTTVPPGANVLLDGAPIGVSPIQKRVRTGSHVVELALEGYEPFKEVIDVPSGGLPFLQPLQKKPPPPPPPPTAGEIAIELFKAAVAAKEAGDYVLAKNKLDEALKLSPGQPAAMSLMKDVDIILGKRSAEAKAAEIAAANGARLSQARVLAVEGRKLYDQGAMGAAKEKLYASLKLDANNPEPHRTLGRIFNREEQVDKVRYHLQRYIELGGADADFKVREWLKTHPKK